MRGLRRLALALAGLAAALVALTLWTAQPGDPSLYPPSGPDVETVFLVSHGWHAGLVLRRESLTGEGAGAALRNIATRFRAFDDVEFGWGEARFYRATPTLAAFDWRLALSALFTPGGSEGVIQVVGLAQPVRESFPQAEIAAVPLSRAGFARLLARLDASFRLADGMPAALGPGLYGPSLFYEGAGRFSYSNVCNHWAAGLLNAAGLPITPVLDTHPAGLLADLRWRAGLNIVGSSDAAPDLSKP
ncbi:DUF2459 domain-containing protein [Methylobacterium sp. R2-1]|uniref:DUF2459 domain-containing protein n=1 Tax=Methylobacterium sp. R2-1 TaxID=2587064 RepID=UPI00160F80AC|nr:DUF2459 domain-containing protein [Methylobacterium sp. R2-1]MBB2962913.1 uncharacterized protein (TIGR02117 family) [Methylobacterium sp. R2-1]